MKLAGWTYAALIMLVLQSCLGGSYEGSSTDILGAAGEQVPVRVPVAEVVGALVAL